MKKWTQFFHLLLLFCLPIVYALLKVNSEPHDLVVNYYEKILVVGGAIWSGCVISLTVKYGTKEKLVESLFNSYRSLLQRYWFLIISDLFLGVLCVLLLCQLLFFRQVEFLSKINVIISENDKFGHITEIGKIEANKPTKFRIRTGNTHIVFKQLNDGTIGSLESFYVPGFWTKTKLPQISINGVYTYEETNH